MTSCVVVREEVPRQVDVERLLKLSDGVAERLYPGAFRRPIDAAALDRTDVVVLLARTESAAAIGFCALLLKPDGTGELKRMIVDPAYRGRGAGKALVQATCEAAQARGVTRLQLEVGIRNNAARVLYSRLGFVERGPFGDYRATLVASFMEKRLIDDLT